MQSDKFYETLGNSGLKNKKGKLDPKDIFLIKTFGSTNQKVLDLGCGRGDLAYEFAKRGNNVLALDGSKSMLKHAKIKNNHPNIKYILLDLRDFKNNIKFDLIFAINSLVHIKNLTPILIKIHKALKRDGKFILCFPHPLQDIKKVKDYSKEKIIRTKTKYGHVEQYYRPIEFYINKLIGFNFIITKVCEFPNKKPDFFIIECQSA
ncbi:MAG: class I SAM-dependent methyltransferase [Nanoarchaeota archaeon]